MEQLKTKHGGCGSNSVQLSTMSGQKRLVPSIEDSWQIDSKERMV
jgi:hypothetical protein